MLEDLRRALRTLVREPGLSLVSVLTIALGTGAAAAVLSVHDAVLLRPLAVEAPAELRLIDESRSGMTSQPVGVDAVPWARYRAYAEALAPVFTGLAAEHYDTYALASDEGAMAVSGYLVSGNYFRVLGVRPRAGRFFQEDDEPSVVLSQDLWRRRFGGDPAAVGRGVRIDGRTYTVVGVAPRDFHGTLHGLLPDIWIPLRSWDPDVEGGAGPWVTFFGRLRPGVDNGRARAAVDAAARSIPPFQPQTTVRGAEMVPLTGLPPEVRQIVARFLVLILLTGVAVLLIASANIAGMLVARGVSRRREVAVRLALGAGPARIARWFLVETLLLFLLGGVGGLALGSLATHVLQGVHVPLGLDVGFRLTPTAGVLAVALALTLVAGALFGLGPSLMAARGDVSSALKEAVRGQARQARGWSFFVASQIVMSVVLLVAAGLFLRSLRQGLAVDPGFDPDGVVVARVDLAALGYDPERASTFFGDLVARVRALSGVEAVGLSDHVLLGVAYGRNTSDLRPVDEIPGGEPRLNAAISVVGPAYFRTLGIDLVAGRGFSDADGPGATGVAVVNETLARRLWPGRNPVGRRFRQDGRAYEVVGVARDGKYSYVTEPRSPYVFRAWAQEPRQAMTLHVRSSLPAARVLADVQNAVRELDPDVALQGGTALSDVVTSTLFPQRFAAAVVGLFGLVGLLFGAVGVYGLLSFHVAQRTHEMGIRVALGARPRRLAWEVVLRTVRLAAVAAVVGLALAALLSPGLRALMIGISPVDPVTYGGVALWMILIAALASFPPARRATVVDPAEALREE